MNRTSTLRSLLVLVLLAAPGFSNAADDSADPPQDPPAHAKHHRFDPVKHTQRHLDKLAEKLNLTAEQQSAWQTYSDAAISRAKERAARMEERRAQWSAAKPELDTAARLDRMSQKMRERADRLQKVAQDTRALQAALTPEQQTILDLYWRLMREKGKRGHRLA